MSFFAAFEDPHTRRMHCESEFCGTLTWFSTSPLSSFSVYFAMFPFSLKTAAAPEFLGIAAREVRWGILFAVQTPDVVNEPGVVSALSCIWSSIIITHGQYLSHAFWSNWTGVSRAKRAARWWAMSSGMRLNGEIISVVEVVGCVSLCSRSSAPASMTQFHARLLGTSYVWSGGWVEVKRR